MQCGSLLDKDRREDFIEDVAEDYEDVRQDHYDGLKDRKYLTIDNARKRKFEIDWRTDLPTCKYYVE